MCLIKRIKQHALSLIAKQKNLRKFCTCDDCTVSAQHNAGNKKCFTEVAAKRLEFHHNENVFPLAFLLFPANNYNLFS
jgi:hypothetical protein